MKNIFKLSVVFSSLMISVAGFAQSAPWEGDGTEASPYLIADEAGLTALKDNLADYSNCCFRLTQDIALTAKWAGIGVASKSNTSGGFEGVFDGAGHVISSVVFSNESVNNYRGLFNKVFNGTVKNLTVSGTGFGTTDLPSGEYGCALVCGLAMNATISNCVANGTIASGTHNVAGAVVRTSHGAKIISCTNNVDVTGGYTKVGGVVCFTESNTSVACLIEGCANNGDITANGGSNAGRDGIGGILAYIGSKGAVTIKDCSNAGLISKGATASANNYIGQMVGYQHQQTATFAGAISGRSDTLMVGYCVGSYIPAWHFATVADTVATLVADGALESGMTYKAMVQNASPTFAFADAGTIAFDQELIAVTSFAGITIPEEGYVLTSNTVGTVTTFTCAVKPVPPGEFKPQPCDTPEEAAAKEKKINDNKAAYIVPPASIADTNAYVNLFAAKTVKVGETYVVSIDLTAQATTNLIEEVNDNVVTSFADLVDATKTETMVTTTPGLYYWIDGGTDVKAISTSGGDELATDVSTTLQKPVLGATDKAFYQLKVDYKQP